MRVVERDRRSQQERIEDEWRRDGGENFDLMLSMAFDGYQRAWERGFVAAMELVAQQNEKPQLAKGTREFDRADTQPYPIVLEDEL